MRHHRASGILSFEKDDLVLTEKSWRVLFILVRKRGVEPLRVLPHRILNPARLPIPPLSRGAVPFNIRQLTIFSPRVNRLLVPQAIQSVPNLKFAAALLDLGTRSFRLVFSCGVFHQP
jgi:hypothetical protein